MARGGWPRRLVGMLVLAFALLGVACDSSRPAPRTMPMAPEPANKAELATLRGSIVVDGSSTVYPVTQAAAEEFARYTAGVRISVGIAGTGGGFKKFCAAETDVQNASRPISSTEAAACAQKGVEYIEIPVAYDGLAVVVSPKNTWVECLTKAELKKIWEPEAQGRIRNWKQVRDSFPDRALTLFGAGTDSGTFDYFTEAIVGTPKSSRGDYQASEDDNVLVQGVSRDENALGYFGFAYYSENADKLKLVKVDNGDGHCVEPTVQTVSDGSYQPLSRPIFVYVTARAADRPEVAGFIHYYLSASFTPLIQSREVGYVALSEPHYRAIDARFTAHSTGTLFPNGAEVGATLDRYLQ